MGLGKLANGRYQFITPYKGSWADTVNNGLSESIKKAYAPKCLYLRNGKLFTMTFDGKLVPYDTTNV